MPNKLQLLGSEKEAALAASLSLALQKAKLRAKFVYKTLIVLVDTKDKEITLQALNCNTRHLIFNPNDGKILHKIIEQVMKKSVKLISISVADKTITAIYKF